MCDEVVVYAEESVGDGQWCDRAQGEDSKAYEEAVEGRVFEHIVNLTAALSMAIKWSEFCSSDRSPDAQSVVVLVFDLR